MARSAAVWALLALACVAGATADRALLQAQPSIAAAAPAVEAGMIQEEGTAESTLPESTMGGRRLQQAIARRRAAPAAEALMMGSGGRKLLQGNRFLAPLAEPLVVPAESQPMVGRRLKQTTAETQMPRRLMAPLAEPALVQAKLPSGGAGGRKLLQGSRFVAPLAEPLVAVVPAETVPTTGRRLQQNEAAALLAPIAELPIVGRRLMQAEEKMEGAGGLPGGGAAGAYPSPAAEAEVNEDRPTVP